MFIVWGKKAVHTGLGYAADFCSICRCASAFAIRRIGMAGHVYCMSVGEGELVGFDRTCQTCDTADPKSYRALAPLRPTAHEVGAVLSELKQHRVKIGSKHSADDLATSLR